MAHTDMAARFSFGFTVSKSFEILLKSFVPFITLSLVLYLPVFVYLYYNMQNPERLQEPSVVIISIMMEIIIYYLLTASLVYGTVQHLNGTPATLSRCFSRGVQSVLPVIGVAVISGIVIILGFLALIIPGFILMTMFWVVVPVAVIERQGVGASLNRSRELTDGCRWPIFGILILLIVGQGVFQTVVGNLLVPSASLGGLDLLPWLLGNWLVTAFFSALAAVTVGVGYYLLRVEKDGADIKTIAAVFD